MYKHIEEIIKKYNILKLNLNTPDDEIKEYIQKHAEGYKNIAIWGTGEHTENLLKLIDGEKINIKCFIDSNSSKWESEYYGKKIYGPQIINELNIDLVIISSYTHRIEIGSIITKKFPNCNYIDLYKQFRHERPFYYKDIINKKYQFYLETCFLIKKDLERLGLSTHKNVLDKLNNIIDENELSYKKTIKSYNGDCLEEQLSFDKEKIKIALFFQSPSGWSSVESVWKELKQDVRCDIKIIQLPFLSKFTSEYNSSREFLTDKEISFIPWYLYNVKRDRADIAIYQSPYDESRPYEYQVNNIEKLGIRIVYIPYGLEIGGGSENLERQFNLEINNKAWIIFSRSQRNKSMYIEYCTTKGKNVIVTGHPKIDAIVNLEKIKTNELLVKKIGDRKAFLWNPHFSIDPRESWSTFNKWKKTMIEIFKENRSIFLIIRPHPLLVDRILSEDEIDLPDIKEFNKDIRIMSNVYLDLSSDYREAFFLSDALITDAGSFLLEYLPTLKPILYLPKEKGPGLNDDGEIVKYYYSADKKNDMKEFINLVELENDCMKEIRISKIEEFLGVPDGKVGVRIKDNIISKFLSEKETI